MSRISLSSHDGYMIIEILLVNEMKKEMIQPINTNDLQESEDEKVEEVTIEIKEEELENTTIIDEDVTIQPKDLYPKEGANLII